MGNQFAHGVGVADVKEEVTVTVEVVHTSPGFALVVSATDVLVMTGTLEEEVDQGRPEVEDERDDFVGVGFAGTPSLTSTIFFRIVLKN